MRATRELRKVMIQKWRIDEDPDTDMTGPEYYFSVTQDISVAMSTCRQGEWDVTGGNVNWLSPTYPTAALRNKAIRNFRKAWAKFMEEIG